MSISDDINTKIVFSSTAIAKSGTSTSADIDLSDYKPLGYFSLQLTVTGDGTAQIKYQLSNDGDTFVTPTSAQDIVTAHTKTTGTSGVDIYSFFPEPAKYIRIVATETGGANTITVTGILFIQ